MAAAFVLLLALVGLLKPDALLLVMATIASLGAAAFFALAVGRTLRWLARMVQRT